MLLCVVAHTGEARALIDFYQLKKDLRHSAFELFKSPECCLIVSGQGRQNTAAATAYLGVVNQASIDSNFWLNIGVAGHENHEIGSLYRINKITDLQGGKSFYPVSLVKPKSIESAPLLTVEVQEYTYAEPALYDMEASAFFATAKRFSSAEFIHVFKVVSDNKANPISPEIRKASTRLLAQHLPILNDCIETTRSKLHALQDKNSGPLVQRLIDSISINIKLTQSQRLQCKNLINSLLVQSVPEQQIKALLRQSLSAKGLCKDLQQRLAMIELIV